MEEKTKSRADRLSKVVEALEMEFADILEELCEEIKADLRRSPVGFVDTPQQTELEETLEALKEGSQSMSDAWHSLFHINMKYYLDAPGKALTEREQA